MLLPLASILLGVLAARSSPDLAMASMMGGTGLAIQRKLDFTRDAEREADRIGLQILNDGGFETTGMVGFFQRMQNATRGYNDSAPSYLRSHPLTTERIADIQDRIRNQRYRQRVDSLDFQLIRARVRVLQDDTVQGRRDAAVSFDGQLLQNSRTQSIAAKYGLAVIAQHNGDYRKAQALLTDARILSQTGALVDNVTLTAMAIELRLQLKQNAEAVEEANAARSRFPLARGIARQYGQALIADGKLDAAVGFLREQVAMYRREPQLQDLLAQAYAAQGKRALQHMALAESYAADGSLPGALDQLRFARQAGDASFYDHSVIDAREREMQAMRRQELDDEGKK